MGIILNKYSSYFNYQKGGDLPNSDTINIDFQGLLSNQYAFDEVRLRYYIDSSWVSILGDDVLAGNIIDSTGISATVNIGFSALDSLSTGDNIAYISFVVEGRMTGESWYAVDSTDFTVIINITDATSITTDKFIYELQYVKSTNTFSGDTIISLLNNASLENCSIELTQSKNFFAIDDASFSDATNIITGANIADLATENSPVGIPAILKNSLGQNIYNFALKVYILENDNLASSTQSLDFLLVKAKSETKTATLKLSNPSNKNFTVTAPSFITITPNSGNSSIDITVSTDNSSTYNLGDYSGNIVFTYDTDKTLVIPVTLSVINFFVSELSTDFNFCLDKKLLKFYKISSDGIFARANLSIIFKTPTETKIVSRTYVVPFFEDKAEMDIGEKLQTYFLKYVRNILSEDSISNYFNQKLWYYPTEVSGTVEELDANYETKTTETLPTYKFFAGKKPLAYPILTNNLIRRRSELSKVILPFISGVTNINDFGANFTGAEIVPEKVATVLKTENLDQLFTWGSVKEFSFGINPIKIYTLQNNNQTINLAFYNSNLVPDWLTITGEYKISDDYNHTISRNVTSGNEEKFDSDKTKTLSINSGFILKPELDILDEISASKLIFIEINGKYYKGILTSNKISKEDSTEELIARDLEFLITEA